METKVLISFGAAFGGFEFALQLRKNIMDKCGKKWVEDPRFVYIDAISLVNDENSRYDWDEKLGIVKMSNENWHTFYEKAMNECAYMIFLISKPWLESKWCWQEFDMYLKTITEKVIKPIFIVFEDAQKIWQNKKVIDKTGKEHSLDPLFQQFITKGAPVIDINSEPDTAVKYVTVDGAKYTYEHSYTCNKKELDNILSKINTGLL